ncbi:hypothetical protein [Microbulbifer sp.]|uniref:hypothetical protein n=1 Tax=Microbulbifer sp. TaxID=1908541 RepID=UPI0025836746|nr:hypothetical protein [Microbulbifer sp.]
MRESREHLKRKVAALAAQVKQRDHEIRDLKAQLALAQYRLTGIQAQCKLLYQPN